MPPRFRTLAAALAATAALLLAAPARAADPLTIELNKLEPIPGQPPGCRAYLVATNPESGETFEQLRLDLVFFSTDGVIARRIALDVGPVAAGRTAVRPFELRDQPCDGIGSILVNDAILCKVAGADRTDCMDRIRTTSRVPVKLTR